MTREEALKIYQAGPEVVVAHLCELHKQLAALNEQVKKLHEQLAKNSHNSSKPPSSDGPGKTSHHRPQTEEERKQGGQKGHPGHTLEMSETPDQTILHTVDRCKGCGCDLSQQPPDDIERRQVLDVPPVKLIVTEHRAQIKQCPYCGLKNKALFPQQVAAPVQYGPDIKAMAVYMIGYQLLPYGRTAEFFQDIFSINISEGTLVNMINNSHELLEAPVEQIRRQLIGQQVIHFDETGCSLGGERQWLHVASTAELTYYAIHEKRGSEATDHIGILPDFKGRAIHDFWKPYFKYKCLHGLCNAHHLRELTFLVEQQQQNWAQMMIFRLLAIKEAVDTAKTDSLACLPKAELEDLETCYDLIIKDGYRENPMPEETTARKRGRCKQSKARNLLDRLSSHREEVLAFMYDFNVPFDNNLAERDIRMTKVHDKISGTFRSKNGADAFCRIRSYISTARKNTTNVISAVCNALSGNPFIPGAAPT